MSRTHLCCLIALWNAFSADASNLSNPATPLPEARVGIGASYHLGATSISNDTVPALFNRLHARITYAPFSVVNFGVDLGTTQVEVAGDTNSSRAYRAFHGQYGFSGGAHLKLSTPFLFDETFALVAIAAGSWFMSENDYGAEYGGMDANGGIGLQMHIPGFGFLTAGSSVYVIEGSNRDYAGNRGSYSNVNNVRGWIALDYFPRMRPGTATRPYLSMELSISPEAKINRRAPIQEVSFSIAVGSVTNRLYGQDSGVEWQP